MIITEAVRHVLEDKNFIDEDALLTRPGTSWTTVKTWTDILVLNKPALVVWNAVFHCEVTSTTSVTIGLRLKIGDHFVGYDAIGYTGGSGTKESELSGVAVFPAGTYTVKVEAVQSTSTTYTQNIGVKPLKLGVTMLADLEYDGVASDLNRSIAAGVTETIVELELTPPKRETCLGTLKKSVLFVNWYARETGDSNNSFTCKVYVDDVEVNWTESAGPGWGNTGKQYIAALPIGEASNLKIKVTNDDGSSHTYDFHWAVSVSPWILTDAFEEHIAIDVPEGSTIYVVGEPLDSNTEEKHIAVGSDRALDWGGTWDDFYLHEHGTGRVTFNHQLTWLPHSMVSLWLKGQRNCLVVIGVDRR